MKSNSYIKEDLEWLEAKLESMKKYVDDNPIDKLKDRIVVVGSERARREVVTANIEQQIKSIKDILKDLPAILEAVDKLRERSKTAELRIKGDQEMPGMMKGKFQNT